jgi:hypothetical protein
MATNEVFVDDNPSPIRVVVEKAGKAVRRYSLGLWLSALLLVSTSLPDPIAGILVVALGATMVEYER